MVSQRQIAQQMREAQGQSHAVEIAYREKVGLDESGEPIYESKTRRYVFKKLKRKKCHQVLYNLVTPFIQIVSAFIESVAVPFNDIVSGNFDVGKMSDDLSKKVMINTDTLVKLVQALPFDDYWALAQNILNDVEIDGVQMGPLDNHEFFDDKPLEMAKAILKGIEVNYPFAKDLIRKKKTGSTDSSQMNLASTKV